MSIQLFSHCDSDYFFVLFPLMCEVNCMCCCSVKELLSRHSVRAQAVATTYQLLTEVISDDVVFKVILFLVHVCDVEL